MKISKETFQILRNFSQLNNGILIKKGNRIKTTCILGGVIAEAQVAENFPQDFAIYDLTKLLATESVMSDSDFQFQTGKILITSGSRKSNFILADESNVKCADYSKKVSMGEIFGQFEMTEREISDLVKMSAILEVPEITISEEDGSIVVIAEDINNDTTGNYIFSTQAETKKTNFKLVLRGSSFKMIEGDYAIELGSGGVHLVNKSVPVQYWIALESSSVF